MFERNDNMVKRKNEELDSCEEAEVKKVIETKKKNKNRIFPKIFRKKG